MRNKSPHGIDARPETNLFNQFQNTIAMFNLKPAIFICFGRAGHIFRSHMEASLDHYLKGSPLLKQCFAFISIGEETPQAVNGQLPGFSGAWLSVREQELAERGYASRIRGAFPGELSQALATAWGQVRAGQNISYWKAQGVEISKTCRLLFVGSAGEPIGGPFIRFCIWNGLSLFSDYSLQCLQVEIAYLLPDPAQQPFLPPQENQLAAARSYAALWELETELQQSGFAASPVGKVWLLAKEAGSVAETCSEAEYYQSVARGFALLLLFLPEEGCSQRAYFAEEVNGFYFQYATFGLQPFSWRVSDFLPWVAKRVLGLEKLISPQVNPQAAGEAASAILQKIAGALPALARRDCPWEVPALPAPEDYADFQSFRLDVQELCRQLENLVSGQAGLVNAVGRQLFDSGYAGFESDFRQMAENQSLGLNGVLQVMKAMLENESGEPSGLAFATRAKSIEAGLRQPMPGAGLERHLSEMESAFSFFRQEFEEEEWETKHKWRALWRKVYAWIFKQDKKGQRQEARHFARAHEQARSAFQQFAALAKERLVLAIVLATCRLWINELERLIGLFARIVELGGPGGPELFPEGQPKGRCRHLFATPSDLEYFHEQLLREMEPPAAFDLNGLFARGGPDWEGLLQEKLALIHDRLRDIRLSNLEGTGLVPPGALSGRLSCLLRETHPMLAADISCLPDAWIVGGSDDVPYAESLLGRSLQENIVPASSPVLKDEIFIFKIYDQVTLDSLLNQSSLRRAYWRLPGGDALALHAPDFAPGVAAVPPLFAGPGRPLESRGWRLFVKGAFSGKLQREQEGGMYFYQPEESGFPVYLANNKDAAIDMLETPRLHDPLGSLVDAWFRENIGQVKDRLPPFLKRQNVEWEPTDSRLLRQIVEEFRTKPAAA